MTEKYIYIASDGTEPTEELPKIASSTEIKEIKKIQTKLARELIKTIPRRSIISKYEAVWSIIQSSGEDGLDIKSILKKSKVYPVKKYQIKTIKKLNNMLTTLVEHNFLRIYQAEEEEEEEKEEEIIENPNEEAEEIIEEPNEGAEETTMHVIESQSDNTLKMEIKETKEPINKDMYYKNKDYETWTPPAELLGRRREMGGQKENGETTKIKNSNNRKRKRNQKPMEIDEGNSIIIEKNVNPQIISKKIKERLNLTNHRQFGTFKQPSNNKNEDPIVMKAIQRLGRFMN